MENIIKTQTLNLTVMIIISTLISCIPQSRVQYDINCKSGEVLDNNNKCIIEEKSTDTLNSCGNIANGESISRVMYQSSSVSTDSICISENQIAICNNGVMSNYSGTYSYSSCTSTQTLSTDCSGPTQAQSTTTMMSSVKRHDVTWTFDRAYPVARYINGDFAVIASTDGVNIISVSPAPSNGMNGSGVNIKARQQPTDIRSLAYSYVDGISYPTTLYAGDALASFISLQAHDNNCDGSSTSVYLNIMGYCSRTFVKGASVLTVVAEAPSIYEFRPSSLGDKTNRKRYCLPTIDQVVNNLPKLEVSTINKLDINQLIRSKERYQFESIGGWHRRASAPADNQATYAAYSNNGLALLGLTVDYPLDKKRELLITVIQHGIELEGASRIGALNTYSDGGHGTHQLSVMAITSALLNNNSYTSYIKTVEGSEKGHTYIGQNGVGLWGQDCVNSYSPTNFNTICILNQYEKGAKDCRDPNGIYDELHKPYDHACVIYQTLNSPYYPAQALAMRLLGAIDDFNHDAFFIYTDRWMNLNGGTYSSAVTEMWNKYRLQGN